MEMENGVLDNYGSCANNNTDNFSIKVGMI